MYTMNSLQRPALFGWIFLLRRTAILLQGSRQKGRRSFGTVSFGRESADGNERYQHPLVSTNDTFLSDEENDSHPKLLSIHVL